VESVLGETLLQRLTSVSPSSHRRYRSQDRATPDGVADRLHTVAMIVADLSGSYNPIGVRRWFERSRQRLASRAPQDILSGEGASSDPGVQVVRQLARDLVDGTFA